MGNSNQNQAAVNLTLTYHQLDSLPRIPSKFTKRIDKRTWSQFRKICEYAVPVSLSHHDAINEHLYQSNQRKKCIWIMMMILLYVALFKSIDNLWINTILFIIMFVIFIIPIIKYPQQRNQFIDNLLSKLRRDLSSFNKQYINQMKCTISHQKTIVMKTSIKINIELFVTQVEYVSNPSLLSKMSNGVIGLFSGGITGGITGVAVVGINVFCVGCWTTLAAAGMPFVTGAALATVATEVVAGGTAALTIYGTGVTSLYVAGCSAFVSAVGGMVTGYKCYSILDALKCSALTGCHWAYDFANIWNQESKKRKR